MSESTTGLDLALGGYSRIPRVKSVIAMTIGHRRGALRDSAVHGTIAEV